MGTSGFAQKYRNSGLFFETQITQGGVLKSNDFVRGDNKKGRPINNYSASDIRIGWQTRGSQAWQHAHKLPYYGICIHSMVFSNAEEIGYPAALYFFFGAPFARKAKLTEFNQMLEQFNVVEKPDNMIQMLAKGKEFLNNPLHSSK